MICNKTTAVVKLEQNYNRTADRRCALLAASALFILGCFLGCAVYRLLGLGEGELYNKLIERYFLALFYKCASPLDVFRVAADCVIHELWLTVAVFLGGFTVFTLPISAAALLYRGLLYGFALTMLQFSSRTGLLMDSIVYLAAMFAISMLLIIMSALAAEHFYPDGRPRLRSPHTRTYIAAFLKITALTCADILAMLFLIYIYI